MPHLQAGTGRSDITPAPGTPQGIWGAQLHQRGAGADMPLYATALALSDGATTALLLAAVFPERVRGVVCLDAMAKLLRADAARAQQARVRPAHCRSCSAFDSKAAHGNSSVGVDHDDRMLLRVFCNIER